MNAVISEQNTAPAVENALLALSSVASITALVAVLLCAVSDVSPIWILSAILAAYVIVWFLMVRHIADPLFVFAAILLQYSFLPNFLDPRTDRFLQLFGLEGGQKVHSAAIIAFLISHAISIIALPQRAVYAARAEKTIKPYRFKQAALYGATISIALSVASIIQRGSVILDDVDYGASFASRLETGSGVFSLAAPLAIAAISFASVLKVKFSSPPFYLSALAFLALFLSNGQRKFFIVPLIIVAASYVRNAKMWMIIGTPILFGVAYIVFIYLGYLRFFGIDYSRLLEPAVIDGFFARFWQNFAGETPPLFATASAAARGYIEALPNFGDYTLAWTMSVPQFLNFGITYISANVRFAYALNPVTAAQGMGWGFSYWAEAYMVGGYMMVAVACLAIVMLYRWLYVKAGGAYLIGLPGVVLLSSLYYALWFQRNAFGYFFKEFIVYQLIAVYLLHFIIAVLQNNFGKSPGVKSIGEST